MTKEFLSGFVDGLSYEQKIFLHGVINLNIADLEIRWDLDQILIMSEIPVLDFVDRDKGTHYSGRKIKGWNSISKWLLNDRILTDEEKALAYENYVWTHPLIIGPSPVNERLQALSYVAWQRGIAQTITTSRISKLAGVTDAQVDEFLPWLSGNVNQRRVDEPGISGEDYKLAKNAEAYSRNPNVVVFDDSMTFMRKFLTLAPNADVLGFPCEEDYHRDLLGGRRIFFPEMAAFSDLLYYPNVNVAQS